MSWTLDELRSAGVLGPLDAHFAEAMTRLAGDPRPEAALAAALLSRSMGAGHVCLDLQSTVGEPLLSAEEGHVLQDWRWPDLDAWVATLRASRMVDSARTPDGAAPLVLDRSRRLYMRRFWEHERRLAEGLRARASEVVLDVDPTTLGDGLDRYFGAGTGGPPDVQRRAAETVIRRRLCIITGGPGTGKTSTVVKILALLVEQAQARGARPPRVALLAPTGKAAARMLASIEREKSSLPASDVVKSAIPEVASTIHRALGPVRGRLTEFRHHRDRPLLADLVLVDEASMVDLALMTRLVDAVHPDARLVLLGDKDQLASVEAGAVLGDVCDAGAAGSRPSSPPSRPRRRRSRPPPADQLAFGFEADAGPPASAAPIGRCIVELTRSWRYAEDSGIGALGRAINRGDADGALEILGSTTTDVSLVEPGEGWRISDALRTEALAGYETYLAADDPDEAVRAFDAYRILCAHRRGPTGVEPVNRLVGEALGDAGLLQPEGACFRGRPVLVTRNDYRVQLYNGDVGLMWDSAGGEGVRAYFVGADGKRRVFSPSRLPPHETVWAMSVHKSQGSEFDSVAVMLPREPSPIVSRELLYTAVTRARKRVTIHASPELVRHAVGTRIRRASGLRDALWG